MKRDIFQDYVDKVTDHFGISREQLFAKRRDQSLVDARHTLYFLSNQRGITNTYIKSYMSEYGHDIGLSSIGHGVKRMTNEIKNDPDYATLIDKLK